MTNNTTQPQYAPTAEDLAAVFGDMPPVDPEAMCEALRASIAHTMDNINGEYRAAVALTKIAMPKDATWDDAERDLRRSGFSPNPYYLLCLRRKQAILTALAASK